MKRCTARKMLALKPPARPRSEVSGTSVIRVAGSRRSQQRVRLGPRPQRDLRDRRPPARCAYGRAPTIASCARRSRAAETSFIARVIFCVDFTDAIRVRMLLSDGMACFRRPAALRRRIPCRTRRARAFIGSAARPRPCRRCPWSSISVQQLGVARVDERVQLALVAPERLDRQVVGEAAGHGEEDEDLLLDRQRLVLPLLEQLGHARAARQLLLGRLVEVGAELRERRQLAVLRELEAQLAGDLLHRRDLRGAADAADRDADVDGRALPREEQVALEEDLPVGDRDDVGRDVRRHVARLRLDDRQRGQRPAPSLSDSFAARSSRREWR